MKIDVDSDPPFELTLMRVYVVRQLWCAVRHEQLEYLLLQNLDSAVGEYLLRLDHGHEASYCCSTVKVAQNPPCKAKSRLEAQVPDERTPRGSRKEDRGRMHQLEEQEPLLKCRWCSTRRTRKDLDERTLHDGQSLQR